MPLNLTLKKLDSIIELNVNAINLPEALKEAWVQIGNLETQCTDNILFEGVYLPLYEECEKINLMHEYYNSVIENKIARLMLKHKKEKCSSICINDVKRVSDIEKIEKENKRFTDEITRKIYYSEGATDVYKQVIQSNYYSEPVIEDIFLKEYSRGIIETLQSNHDYKKAEKINELLKIDNIKELKDFVYNGELEGFQRDLTYKPITQWYLNKNCFLLDFNGYLLSDRVKEIFDSYSYIILSGNIELIQQILDKQRDMRPYIIYLDFLVENNLMCQALMITKRLQMCGIDFKTYMKNENIVKLQIYIL